MTELTKYICYKKYPLLNQHFVTFERWDQMLNELSRNDAKCTKRDEMQPN